MRKPAPVEPTDLERDAKRFLIGVVLIGIGLAMRPSRGWLDPTVIAFVTLGLCGVFGGANVWHWLQAWWLEFGTGAAVLWLIHRPLGVLLILVACTPVACIYIDAGGRTEPPRFRFPRFSRPRQWIAQAWHGLAVPGLMAAGGLLGPQGWLTPIADLGRLIQLPYRAASQRRWFRWACLNAGIDRPPKVGKVDETKAGWKLSITTRPGMPVEWLAEHAIHIGTTLRRNVRVRGDHADPAKGTVSIIERDPFAGPPVPWPQLNTERTSIWNPVPIGYDEDGETVTIDLVYKNVLLGGIPNAGKSNVLNMLVGHCALDPSVQLHVFDGKGMVEMQSWHGSAASMAGDATEAIPILRGLTDTLKARQADLRRLDKKKVRPGDNLPVHVIAIDELSEFTTAPKAQGKDGKLTDPAKEFNALLRPIVNVGRACGFVVIGCTLKPESKVVDPNMRDLFSTRLALECMNPDASDTILGKSMASLGWNAQEITNTPGRGILVGKSSGPRFVQAFLLDDRDDGPDADHKRIAARAAALRPAPAPIAPARSPQPEPVLVPDDGEGAPAVHDGPCTTTPRRGAPEPVHAQSVHTNGNGNGHAVVTAAVPSRNGNSPAKLKRLQTVMAKDQLRRELERDPDRSTRVLGEVVGLSASKVGQLRREWGYGSYRPKRS